jgi:uncharacterized protein (DUF1800 family)
MPDGTALNPIDTRHLLRRTGFGATQAQVDDLATTTRGVAVTQLLSFKPSGFRPGGRDHRTAHNKWVKYMLTTKHPLQEKLVLFWHDHFSTGISKVQNVKLVGSQNRLLRLNCKGSFEILMKAINKDPAMIEYLDTVRNGKEIPNENYAREVQELFTLGVKDVNGINNYTQEDIVQIARAFTGWGYDKGVATFDPNNHDSKEEFDGDPGPDRGPKVIYKTCGGFGPGGMDYAAGGEGEMEIDAIIDIILQHKDTDGKNTVARRIARRLCEYFAHPDPDQTFVDDVVAFSGFDTNWDIAGLLHQIFVHDAFYDTAIPGGTKRSIRWPIDYVVSSLRLLKVKPKGGDFFVDGFDYSNLFDQLTNMGQTLFDPPSVFGWDWETNWISSSTLLARYGFARSVIQARSGGGGSLRTEKLFDLGMSDPGDIVDAVSGLLGVKDYLSVAERDILKDYLTNNNTVAPDLNDYAYRNRKLHGLIALVMQSPAYQLH